LRLLVCWLAILCAARAEAASADLVFVNGAVYTVDAARSWASAVAITGERITYVGDDATARTFIDEATRVIDLNHRMLLPGFQDSHVHPGKCQIPRPLLIFMVSCSASRYWSASVNMRKPILKSPGSWATAGMKVAFLPTGNPTREMLDGLIGDRPAFVTDNSGHDAWVNSRALSAARIRVPR
jgi:predicted amidohydrolase YtcJ